MHQLPNLLSIFRVLLGFSTFYTLRNGFFNTTLYIVIVAILTDFLDGYLARKYDVTSTFGKVIDPLADKICFVCLFSGLYLIGSIPLSVVVLFVMRDVIMVLGWLTSYVKDKAGTPNNLGPLMIGKINTTIQFLYISFVLINRTFNIADSFIEQTFLFGTLFLTITSTVPYIIRYAKLLKR